MNGPILPPRFRCLELQRQLSRRKTGECHFNNSNERSHSGRQRSVLQPDLTWGFRHSPTGTRDTDSDSNCSARRPIQSLLDLRESLKNLRSNELRVGKL